VVFVMTLAACGGAAETCEELADETIELVQAMIDEVEDEMGDTTIEEILASEGDLPSLDRFRDRAAEVDERATELQCGQDELQTLIQARAGELEATTPIGELIIDGIRSGGL
jgi:hypothetical protein